MTFGASLETSPDLVVFSRYAFCSSKRILADPMGFFQMKICNSFPRFHRRRRFLLARRACVRSIQQMDGSNALGGVAGVL